ncbi:hypothetical protein IQ254_18615 [Nodosilinea sp. LEGE 07088]|uniref:hypothetical protein n=1 Tax=Nodosilinea sp. LEGE 07088 TaxID=2777968 RepID=UPI00187F498A|nr:hypothetical protein [Nodosilinea sp. LEGE 07088]MBE9139184.1 hypothetical protein [Nodosilinea sp. LEGE 07088]
MSSTNLIRWGGLAAIIAGILRGVSSFLSSSNPGAAIELFYLLTDIFIIFGMMGLYGFQHQESGLWGFFGFLLAIIGIGIIRTGSISGVNMYPIGALIFVVGLSSFAVGCWIANKLPFWISAFWLLSTLVGCIGYFVPGLNLLFTISGVLFGLGFASAGFKIWSVTSSQL